MALRTYRWPALREFRDRTRELADLEAWWASPSREPINLYGRRRVGKSWLFRRFAHGKPAVILVADRVVTGQQLTHMADQLTEVLDLRPQLNSVAELFVVLYDLAKRRKVLVVIDEFPYLHGRLRPLPVWPMPFGAATLLLAGHDPIEKMTRYSIAGGMPRYLDAFAAGDLTTTLASTVVDPYSQLFNEPRTLLQTELREPAVYFSILAELAGNPQDAATIAAGLRMESKELSGYLDTLEQLRLVTRRRPVGSPEKSRTTQWKCTDHFVRFWFRSVQPYQAELEAGADPRAHVEKNVIPHLSDHTAPAFEDAVTAWVRRRHAGSAAVGTWWGPALNRLRATKERSTEEIDTIALHGKKVAAVAEANWTNKPMGAAVLSDLLEYKLPALAQAGFNTAGAEIVLASRSGFTNGLLELTAVTPNTHLVEASELLTDLINNRT